MTFISSLGGSQSEELDHSLYPSFGLLPSAVTMGAARACQSAAPGAQPLPGERVKPNRRVLFLGGVGGTGQTYIARGHAGMSHSFPIAAASQNLMKTGAFLQTTFRSLIKLELIFYLDWNFLNDFLKPEIHGVCLLLFTMPREKRSMVNVITFILVPFLHSNNPPLLMRILQGSKRGSKLGKRAMLDFSQGAEGVGGVWASGELAGRIPLL